MGAFSQGLLSIRYPLLVDPQGQAMTFLRNHMESRDTPLHVLTLGVDVPIGNVNTLSMDGSHVDTEASDDADADDLSQVLGGDEIDDGAYPPFVQPDPMPQIATPRSASSARSGARGGSDLLRQATAHARSASASGAAVPTVDAQEGSPAAAPEVPRSPVRRMHKSSSADSLLSRASTARASNDADDEFADRGLYRHTRRGSVDSLLGAAVGGTAILLSLPQRQGTEEGGGKAHANRASLAAAQGWLDRRVANARLTGVASRHTSGDWDDTDAVSESNTVVPVAAPQLLTNVTMSWVARLAQAVHEGEAAVVDGIGERIPPELRGLLCGPHTVRSGRRFAFVNGALVPIHPSFRLFLATTHPDPHFPPEAQASVTLINFNLSTAALTEQLLASTVSHVQPALSRRHAGIRTRMAVLRAQLQEHENSLLKHLADAPGDILSDATLVQTLETTRQAAAHTNLEVAATEATEARVGKAYERFRSVASFLAHLFQLVRRLSSLSPVYQLSLRS